MVFPQVTALPCGNTSWAPSGSKRRPTDQKCDRGPLRRLATDDFVRGSLSLADSVEQRFSLLCAINVPQDVEAVDADGSPSTIQLEVVADTDCSGHGALGACS